MAYQKVITKTNKSSKATSKTTAKQKSKSATASTATQKKKSAAKKSPATNHTLLLVGESVTKEQPNAGAKKGGKVASKAGENTVEKKSGKVVKKTRAARKKVGSAKKVPVEGKNSASQMKAETGQVGMGGCSFTGTYNSSTAN